ISASERRPANSLRHLPLGVSLALLFGATMEKTVTSRPLTLSTAEGKLLEKVTLEFGDLAPTAAHPAMCLAIVPGGVVVKRRDQTEMWQEFGVEVPERL